ncbi:hypothetical protein PHLGIDRAFT_121719 [Phlebiopsis gigantea 11061_1 CR5-6]|uniref:Plasmid pRiA4b Orf3-like domain-containing protein n=1 Tax=Phlebiopsis gigantea (strain 11061_1 CR5-6) TaxID=745531 RepID=A0A0C3RSE3_PHLG1|nr:hypothetical protein PHLGIDRAFT_121719 [Phlebiopsis gigantea 11061_1 CR5-6]
MSSKYANPMDGRVNAADPRRVTPRGELKMPKFVRFKYEDTGAGLNEVFWEAYREGLGSLNLAVFSDKVIKPLFGLVRNLHAHTFTDFTDGALFGPKDCTSIDMMHIDKIGHAYVPDKDYTIAHIVQMEGDAMGYYYDFGDNWSFAVKVIEVLPVEENTGAVTVLSGRGAHLPDGVAWPVWRDLMADVDKGPKYRKAALDKMYTDSSSYQKQRRDPNFDFDRFSIPQTQAAVQAALDSKASLANSSKRYLTPMVEDYDEQSRTFNPGLKKGQKLVRTVLPTGTILQEGVAIRRPDHPDITACTNCGSPNDLKACSGFRQKYYCSRSC